MPDQETKSQYPSIVMRGAIPRRQLLKGAGAALALPLLDAMRPAFAQAKEDPPRRFLAICNNLGLLDEGFTPKDGGRDYTLSPYLQELKEFRQDFTAFSGVSH